jgi:hypothetical protein
LRYRAIKTRLRRISKNWIYGDPVMKKSRLLGVVCAFASAIGSMTSSAASISDFNDPSLAGGVLINFNQFTTNEYLNDFTVGTVSFIDTIQFGGN